MSTIILVDPEPLIIRGLKDILGSDPDFDVAATASDATTALRLVRETSPALVIAEFCRLPEGGGPWLIQTIAREMPRVRIIALSSQAEAVCAERALRAGAHGYVLRHEEAGTILQGIRHVLAGGRFISPPVLDELLDSLAHSRAAIIPTPSDVLSQREIELFEMMGHGLDLRQIAEEMGVTEKTAASYRTRVKDKLNLRSTLELMRRATQWMNADRVCYSRTREFCPSPAAQPANGEEALAVA